RRTVGGQDSRLLLAGGLHDPGQEIEHRDIDPDLFVRMEVAQEEGKFLHHPRNRTVVVPIKAAEGFARMRVREVEPVRLRRWRGNGKDYFGKHKSASGQRQKQGAIHRPRRREVRTNAFPWGPFLIRRSVNKTSRRKKNE